MKIIPTIAQKQLYNVLKTSYSENGLKLLYALLFTTRNSHFESKFHLTSFDFDRNAFLLLQQYYKMPLNAFSQLFEEYSMDLFSPNQEKIDQDELLKYLNQWILHERKSKKEEVDKIDSENAADLKNQLDAAFQYPYQIMEDIWNE